MNDATEFSKRMLPTTKVRSRGGNELRDPQKSM